MNSPRGWQTLGHTLEAGAVALAPLASQATPATGYAGPSLFLRPQCPGHVTNPPGLVGQVGALGSSSH